MTPRPTPMSALRFRSLLARGAVFCLAAILSDTAAGQQTEPPTRRAEPVEEETAPSIPPAPPVRETPVPRAEPVTEEPAPSGEGHPD
jgi:hypothetical protein